MVNVSFTFLPSLPTIFVRTVIIEENSPARPLGLKLMSIFPDLPGDKGRGEKSDEVQSHGVDTVMITNGADPVFLYLNEQCTGPFASRILPKSKFLLSKVIAGPPA